MKKLTIIFLVALLQGLSIFPEANAKPKPRSSFLQQPGTSFILPSNRFQNYGIPSFQNTENLIYNPIESSSVTSLSSINELQPNFGVTTPTPNFQFNEGISSTTVAPDISLSQDLFSSTPTYIQNIPDLTSSNFANINFDQARFSLGNLGVPSYTNINDISKTVDNAAISDFSQYTTQQPQLGTENSVTIKAITSEGYVNDAFGIAERQSEKEELLQNVFFFSAPDEPEAVQPRINFIQPKKKNLNLIFIKAPAPPSINAINVNPPEIPQDKTRVYVLVKKPTLEQNILVKTPPVQKPPKPEVFFLKYENEQEAQEAIAKVQSEKDSLNQNQLAVSTTERTLINEPLGSNEFSRQGVKEQILNIDEKSAPLNLQNIIVPRQNVPSLPTNSYALLNSYPKSSTFNPEFLDSSISSSTISPELLNLSLKSSTFSPEFLDSSISSSSISPGLFGSSFESSTFRPEFLDSSISSSSLRPGLFGSSFESSTFRPEFIDSSIRSSSISPEFIDESIRSSSFSPGLFGSSFESSTFRPELRDSSSISSSTFSPNIFSQFGKK